MILGINDIGMFRKYLTLIIFCFFSISFSAYASPEEDLEELRIYHLKSTAMALIQLIQGCASNGNLLKIFLHMK